MVRDVLPLSGEVRAPSRARTDGDSGDTGAPADPTPGTLDMQYYSLVVVAAAATSFACSILPAQAAPPPSRLELVDIRSGIHRNAAPVEGVVWREFVNAPPGAPWMRLYFSKVWLDKGSYLRIASLRDGDAQTLRMEHVEQWS